jgi:type II secretory pathway pseudopilin PulG
MSKKFILRKNVLKKRNAQWGFTLIEMLAVIVIVIVIAAIVGGIITSVLRGANRSNSISDVQQNGNFALSQMTRMIQFAKSFDGVSKDGVNFTQDCTTPAITPTPAPVLYQSVEITNADDLKTTFQCVPAGVNTASTIASMSAQPASNVSLLDTNSVTLINCGFTCSQQTIVDSPTIGISFTLQKQQGQSSFFESVTSLLFQTNIIMRNNNR